MSRFTFTGRLVQGDPCTLGPVQKDDRTGQPKMTKDGQPLRQFFAAIAVPKDPAQRFAIPGNPTYDEVKALLDNDARVSWPQFFGQRNPGLQYPTTLAPDCTNPKFANKIVDGDGFDEKGQPNSAKDGWAGCWVIKCVTMFAPKVYEWTTSGWQETVHTGRKIKCGDFVTVSGDCTSNESTQTPGMYMNMDTVSFEQEGPAIIGTNNVDPNAALGSRGAPPNPPAGHAAAGGQHPPGNAGAASAGGAAHGGQNSGTASGAYSGYRQPDAAAGAPPPPAGAGAPPPPAPSGPQMTAAATTTYDAYRAAGWTDDQLRANGLML